MFNYIRFGMDQWLLFVHPYHIIQRTLSQPAPVQLHQGVVGVLVGQLFEVQQRLLALALHHFLVRRAVSV
jgi:hypothetical protein